jgi:hypothetical protein
VWPLKFFFYVNPAIAAKNCLVGLNWLTQTQSDADLSRIEIFKLFKAMVGEL